MIFEAKYNKRKKLWKNRKISEKIGEISGKIGNYREKSEKVWKNRTNEISVHFSFRGSPKNDISAKYRPKKPKFLSMVPDNKELKKKLLSKAHNTVFTM